VADNNPGIRLDGRDTTGRRQVTRGAARQLEPYDGAGLDTLAGGTEQPTGIPQTGPEHPEDFGGGGRDVLLVDENDLSQR